MAIVTHATCKSKESLRHCCGIREGFTDGQGEEGKKKFQDLLSGPWFRHDVENEVDFDEEHDVLVKMSRASLFLLNYYYLNLRLNITSAEIILHLLIKTSSFNIE